jgi:hypothetical protein
MELSSSLDAKIKKLARRLQEHHDTQSILQIDNAFVALTSDVITDYCYGKSWDFLDDKYFRSEIRVAANDSNAFVHLYRFFPWLEDALPLIPEFAWHFIQPGIATLFGYQEAVFAQSLEGIKMSQGKAGRTIFDKLTDPTLPAEERALRRIQDEALEVLLASTETTGSVLTLAIFYLLENRDMWNRLQRELKQALPHPESVKTLPELERLPYLVLYPANNSTLWMKILTGYHRRG